MARKLRLCGRVQHGSKRPAARTRGQLSWRKGAKPRLDDGEELLPVLAQVAARLAGIESREKLAHSLGGAE
eukprot:scaffold34862_cov61-Phaeocystis_antarctica.AAC.8